MADASKQSQQTFVGTSKVVQTEFPLIDNDPHFKRVIKYARPSDYFVGLGMTAMGPTFMCAFEYFFPSGVGRGAYPRILRLAGLVGVTGGFLCFYQRSISVGTLQIAESRELTFAQVRFYGMRENAREVEMDMREMVAKVKAGEPLYGKTSLSPHLQGVAARQSRYSALKMGLLPWFNFVNHNQHGVDTAKYYQQAERELSMEDDKKSGVEAGS
ncbi:hypothetical protein CDD81_1280 [Ophiocordyceps australis]|uniref:NADH-ubiquinone oxidoreductase 21kDa subunit N-terminal domain-containing protein n=1 Tax=Ophiocordyceps australis TaxID=1399860 RepID=A0A2C5Y0K1_9HYPO|nr:hypothetical protein CDD81_1280 [Ophiocordyceps australis]